MQVAVTEIVMTIKKPSGLFPNGIGTFIPQKLDIIVGIANTIVIDVKVGNVYNVMK